MPVAMGAFGDVWSLMEDGTSFQISEYMTE